MLGLLAFEWAEGVTDSTCVAGEVAFRHGTAARDLRQAPGLKGVEAKADEGGYGEKAHHEGESSGEMWREFGP